MQFGIDEVLRLESLKRDKRQREDLSVAPRPRRPRHRLRRYLLAPKKINVSTVLAGQRLGIKEVDEGIWLVTFIAYDLGYIDLEQRTLQPIDNPFGPRLSPMS
jgi:hypothetical protein